MQRPAGGDAEQGRTPGLGVAAGRKISRMRTFADKSGQTGHATTRTGAQAKPPSSLRGPRKASKSNDLQEEAGAALRPRSRRTPEQPQKLENAAKSGHFRTDPEMWEMCDILAMDPTLSHNRRTGS